MNKLAHFWELLNPRHLLARLMRISNPITTQKQEKIIAAFLEVNEHRLQRACSMLKPKQATFIRLLPCLFEGNNPQWPGYIDSTVPSGVSHYTPSAAELQQMAQLYGSAEYERSITNPIWAIYAMGSVGTIAHATGSDFDLWLVHDPDLDEEQLQLLQQKATAIELAADALEIEMHFFFINPEKMRNGEMNALSSESSGTAQFRLLLDELYRTAMIMAGRLPAWWLVHPDNEDEYAAMLKKYGVQHLFLSDRVVDCGSLATIDVEEFFGASVWQFVKAITSPYKSMMKLLLIESYIQQYPDIPLLSRQFKQLVYDGAAIDELDPYCMLSQHLDRYLQQRDENYRLILLRRAFYLKNGLSMSGKQRVPDWKMALQKGLLESWGWNQNDITLMENHTNWTVRQLVNERQIINQTLATSYKILSQALKEHNADTMISDYDMTMLGRKLFAFYERKRGKIELVRYSVDSEMYHHQLSIYEDKEQSGRTVWKIYPGYVGASERGGASPMKLFASLLEGLIWIYFNGIWREQTQVNLFVDNKAINHQLITKLGETLRRVFPLAQYEMPHIEDYSATMALRQHYWFIHVGTTPMLGFDPKLYQGMGKSREPLRFGSNKQFILQRLDWIYTTTYGEVWLKTYSDEEGLATAICKYFNWFAEVEDRRPDTALFTSWDGSRGDVITNRLKELFSEFNSFFFTVNKQQRRTRRFILAMGKCWFLFSVASSYRLAYAKIESDEELQNWLHQGTSRPVMTRFDHYALYETPLAAIYQYQQCNIVQVFGLERRNSYDIWVIDERGMLFHCEASINHYDMTIESIVHFLQMAAKRLNQWHKQTTGKGLVKQVEYYQVSRSKQNRFMVKQQEIPTNTRDPKVTLGLMLTANKKLDYSLQIGEEKFATTKQGTKWVATARASITTHFGAFVPIDSVTFGAEFIKAKKVIYSCQLLQYRQRCIEKLATKLQKTAA